MIKLLDSSNVFSQLKRILSVFFGYQPLDFQPCTFFMEVDAYFYPYICSRLMVLHVKITLSRFVFPLHCLYRQDRPRQSLEKKFHYTFKAYPKSTPFFYSKILIKN